MEEKIIAYLIEHYRPEGIVKYGSFANGSNNVGSDFDALVIADCPFVHDSSVIDGTVLDVFVYPPETFQGEYDPEDFVQIFDGEILLDKNGCAACVKAEILRYLDNQPKKSREELCNELDWCRKMLSRCSREDAEGFYRRHWLLCDSLEIYFDLIGKRYFGPKKSLRFIEQADPNAYSIYSRALKEFSLAAVKVWVEYLETKA